MKNNYLLFLCIGKLKEYDDIKRKECIIQYKWIGSLKITKSFMLKMKDNSLSEKQLYLIREKCCSAFCEALYKRGFVNNVKLYNSFIYKEVTFLKSEPFSEEELKEEKDFFIKEYHTITSTFTKVGVNLIEELLNFKNSIDWNNEKGNWIVYQHISPNGKSYIGITQQSPFKRWKNGNGYYKQKKFYNAIKKYGWENFQHNILKENICEEAASYWEKYYIKEFNSYYNGYNATEGGLLLND